MDNQILNKKLAMKAKELWHDIRDEVARSAYTAEDVPKLIRQVREKYRGNEKTNAN